jgi:DNA polymerase-3 subunit epsilon
MTQLGQVILLQPMKLKLTKPLIVFDLESTGVNVSTDRIVEIYMIKIFPDGTEKHLHQRINPGIPIPKDVTAIHGITDADVALEPSFKDKSHAFKEFIGNADFGGFNANRFDFPMLVEEFYRAGVEFSITGRKFIDAQRIFHIMEPRNLAAAYRFYCDKTLENAHSAKADTLATWEIIKSQIDRYPEIEPNLEELNKISGQEKLVDLAGRFLRDEKGEATFNFGKHKGKSVAEILQKEPSYYEWMMAGDFPENTKRVLTELRLNLFGSKP